MTRLNCWEFKQCGREPGGARDAEFGVCPAAMAGSAGGYLGGRNGGRACAFIAGTLCGGAVQGDFAHKQGGCFACDFFQLLTREEGGDFNYSSFLQHIAQA